MTGLRWVLLLGAGCSCLAGCAAGGLSTQTATGSPIAAQTTPQAPTPTRTPRPTSTNPPRPSATPIPSWVTDFAQPILNAIAGRPPDYQDDFSQASPDWQREMANCTDNGCVISNGVLSLTTAPARGSDAIMTIPCMLNFRSFALSVDVDTSLLDGENAAGIGYDNDGAQFSFELKDKGRWWMDVIDSGRLVSAYSGQLPRPVPLAPTFTIAVRGTRFAIYLDDFPIVSGGFAPAVNRTGLTLRAWEAAGMPAIVHFDNLRIWNLDSDPDLP